jgi:hypothetical protein
VPAFRLLQYFETGNLIYDQFVCALFMNMQPTAGKIQELCILRQSFAASCIGRVIWIIYEQGRTNPETQNAPETTIFTKTPNICES